MKRRLTCAVLALCLLLCSACGGIEVDITTAPAPTATPVPTPGPSPTPEPTPTPDNGDDMSESDGSVTAHED